MALISTWCCTCNLKVAEPPTTLNQYNFSSVLFMTFQYFSENLAYYALILKSSTLPLKSVQVLKNQYVMVGGSEVVVKYHCVYVSVLPPPPA